MLADDIEIELDLGDQDDIRARCEPRVEGDPARVAAHELDDHDAVMRGGRRVHSIERFGRDMDRGLEPEGDVGAVEVVVDGFGNPNAVDPRRGVGLSNGHRPVAPDDDQCLDLADLQVRDAHIRQVSIDDFPVFVLAHWVPARVGLVVGPEDRAPHREDVGDIIDVERAYPVLDQPEEPVLDPEDFDPVVDGVFDDGSDDCVEPGAIPAAREDSDAFDVGDGDAIVDSGHGGDDIGDRRSVAPCEGLKS